MDAFRNFRGIYGKFRGVPKFPRDSENLRGVTVTESTPRCSFSQFRGKFCADERSAQPWYKPGSAPESGDDRSKHRFSDRHPRMEGFAPEAKFDFRV